MPPIERRGEEWRAENIKEDEDEGFSSDLRSGVECLWIDGCRAGKRLRLFCTSGREMTFMKRSTFHVRRARQRFLLIVNVT